MKKFFMMVVSVFFATAVSAQHEVGSITVQPKVGLNLANLTEGGDIRAGFVGGAEFEYQATDMFSVSAGALFSMQGCKNEERIDGVDFDEKITLNYIHMPIMANVYVAKGLAVKLGIQPGINVTAEYEIEAAGVSISGDLDGEPFYYDMKTFDFSIPIGISYEYKNFVIDGRYNWGLTKVADGAKDKNSVFQFTVGYKFDL
ncbi:MAG: PorT family protein [Prevotella sp.]|nr:PorT family protein [Prevotella sp.]MEE1093149.1 porin family protein [Prevotella sp.]